MVSLQHCRHMPTFLYRNGGFGAGETLVDEQQARPPVGLGPSNDKHPSFFVCAQAFAINNSGHWPMVSGHAGSHGLVALGRRVLVPVIV